MKSLKVFQRLHNHTASLRDEQGLAKARNYLRSQLSLAELEEAVTSKNSRLRRCSTLLLIYWGGDDAFRLLSQVLASDPSPIIRHEAAFGLTATKSPKAADRLKRAILSDKSSLVQHEAIEALSDLMGSRATPFIGRFRKDPDPLIRDTVIAMLD